MLEPPEKEKIAERSNFYVVAGGPGSGKTALIEALRARARGQLCVDECIRNIIRQQVKIGGYGLHWKDQRIFQELILSWSIEAFESVSERVRPVFFDRGIPELLGNDRPAALKHFQLAAEIFRYNSEVFMAPPWKQIYCTDGERNGDFDHAIEAYRATLDAYLKCGYSLIELPRVSPEIRTSFVMEQLSAPADPESKYPLPSPASSLVKSVKNDEPKLLDGWSASHAAKLVLKVRSTLAAHRRFDGKVSQCDMFVEEFLHFN